MQGLGSGAISLFGTESQKSGMAAKGLIGRGDCSLCADGAGNGIGCRQHRMRAERRDGWVLTGEKSYISNGTIADCLTVFARTGSAEDGARGISAFIVRGDDPGLSVAERIEVIAPHPLARLKFDGVQAELLGTEGDGFRSRCRR
jgi:acyl-CoA dehydrogenase